MLKINSKTIKGSDKYDDEKISNDEEQLLKKRNTIDEKLKMKHLHERWIPIEMEHLLNVIYMSLFRV